MFNPMRAFKKMHHDKCIDGSNYFAPRECKWFLYSREKLPVYQYAIKSPIEFSMAVESGIPTEPVFKKIELRRLPGPPDEDGYYSYIAEN